MSSSAQENFYLYDTYPAASASACATSDCYQVEQFGYGAGDDGSECPAATPCLEQGSGRSLYWQDPCGGGYRNEEPLFHDSRRAQLYASIESVAFFRHQPARGLSRFDLSDMETGFDHSLRAVVGGSLGDWYRLDFSWTGGFSWDDRLDTTIGSRSETVALLSRMKTGEINLRRRMKIRDWPQHYPDYWNSFEFSTLLGYRYLEVDEELRYQSDSPFGSNSGAWNTTNTLSGIQIGGLGQWLYEDRGWLDLEVKGALLSNDLSVVATANAFRGDERRTAFLVDASLVGNYQFAPCITLRLGYNLMWMSGMALAADNVASNAGGGLSSARHDGEAIYHGPSIGLVFTR